LIHIDQHEVRHDRHTLDNLLRNHLSIDGLAIVTKELDADVAIRQGFKIKAGCDTVSHVVNLVQTDQGAAYPGPEPCPPHMEMVDALEAASHGQNVEQLFHGGAKIQPIRKALEPDASTVSAAGEPHLATGG
jgi:hypothetical protein